MAYNHFGGAGAVLIAAMVMAWSGALFAAGFALYNESYNPMPNIASFCGYRFGSVAAEKGDHVESTLARPFRGFRSCTLNYGSATRKLVCVVLEQRFTGDDMKPLYTECNNALAILRRKYNTAFRMKKRNNGFVYYAESGNNYIDIGYYPEPSTGEKVLFISVSRLDLIREDSEAEARAGDAAIDYSGIEVL